MRRCLRGKAWMELLPKRRSVGVAADALLPESALVRHPRFQVHFTPTSASWLNQVERWFATLTHRCVRRSTQDMEQALSEYVELNNAAPKPFVWTKSADQIFASIKRFCLKTLNHNSSMNL
jgi:hypothetical protein